MQNVAQGTTSDSQKSHEKQSAAAAPPPLPPSSASVHHDTGKTSSTPQSSNSSPTKSETETFSELQPRFMTDSSESEEDSVSEVNAKRDSPSRNVIRLSVCTACRGQDMRVRERMGTERWNEKGRERERGIERRKEGEGRENVCVCTRLWPMLVHAYVYMCRTNIALRIGMFLFDKDFILRRRHSPSFPLSSSSSCPPPSSPSSPTSSIVDNDVDTVVIVRRADTRAISVGSRSPVLGTR